MNHVAIEYDRTEAQEAYKLYRAHRGAHTKEDGEISRIYYQIARGRKVVRAHESIRAAGRDSLGRPKLAMIRADVRFARLDNFTEGRAVFRDDSDRYSRSKTIKVDWPDFPSLHQAYRALVPMIPVHLRPSYSLDKYHILWEADWEKVPVDPMLLKRLSGDAWLVVAAWDLTAVEQAVLAGRL